MVTALLATMAYVLAMSWPFTPIDDTPTGNPERESHLSRALGENVSRIRKEQALTKKSLASLSGISRPSLDHIESGHSNVRLSFVQQIADALCVDPAELLVGASAHGPANETPDGAEAGMRLPPTAF